MRRIDIVVATRNRLRKLRRMLASLPAEADGVAVFPLIVCDGDELTYAYAMKADLPAILVRSHSGQTLCRNLAIARTEDAVVYATDDIAFDPGALASAVRDFKESFPDEDGVVGFTQRGNRFHPTGVALVGRPFVRRYPDQKLFYPGYWHFAAQEIYDAAAKLRRFRLSAASVYHWHPFLHAEEMDETHREARRMKAKDFKTRADRRRRGLVWGING